MTDRLREALPCYKCGQSADDSDHGYGGTHAWEPDTELPVGAYRGRPMTDRLREALESLDNGISEADTLGLSDVTVTRNAADALRAALAATPAPDDRLREAVEALLLDEGNGWTSTLRTRCTTKRCAASSPSSPPSPPRPPLTPSTWSG